MIENIDTGLIIFFLGIIALQTERLRRDLCKLKVSAIKNHPDDFK